MYEAEKKRLSENILWFQKFFGDVTRLFSLIEKQLQAEFPLPKSSTYNVGSNKRVYIPSSCTLYLGGGDFAVHVHAILTEEFIKIGEPFRAEPSLAVVKFSRGDLFAHITDTTIRIFQNDGVSWEEKIPGVVSGVFGAGKAKDGHFHAFQVSLDHFIHNPQANNAIQTEIVDRLRALPDWVNP